MKLTPPSPKIDILKMPLATFLGIEKGKKPNSLLQLSYSDKLSNHLGTYHASVLYSLAEISSGYFLAQTFPNKLSSTRSLVRRSSMKHVAIPANDELYTQVSLTDQNLVDIEEHLDQLGKVTIVVHVDTFDVNDKLVDQGQFEWFVSHKS